MDMTSAWCPGYTNALLVTLPDITHTLTMGLYTGGAQLKTQTDGKVLHGLSFKNFTFFINGTAFPSLTSFQGCPQRVTDV
jgi:hypothetical protein